jgi:DNA-binding transcriptional MerR regulator
MLLKIGDFSRLAHVSPKTLHHYDEIGLFRPARVDPFTGYRFYSLGQLPRLNRILALRDLGFSLERIGQLVDGNLKADDLRGMLLIRREQIQYELEVAENQLKQVEIRLRWIELEGKMPGTEVRLKTTSALQVAGARELVPSPDLMRERCVALDVAARGLIEEARLQTDNVSLALYHDNGEAGIDVEMAYVIAALAGVRPASETARVHSLPEAQVAYAVYKGSYDDFAAVGQVHAALSRWIDEHGLHVAGPVREFYLEPPRDWTKPQGVMEIQYPVT